jgi:hypothetical protein
MVCAVLGFYTLSEIGTSSIDAAQLNRFYLKTERKSSPRNVVFSIINGTTNDVQKHNICYILLPTPHPSPTRAKLSEGWVTYVHI